MGAPSRTAVTDERNLLAQTLGGILRLTLLRHVENDGDQDNGRDDGEARDVAGKCRNGRRKKQDQDQWIAETFDKGDHEVLGFGRVDPVRSDRLEPRGGFGRVEAGVGGVQPLKEIGERDAGKVR